MIYILKGSDEYFLRQKLNEIRKKHVNIVHYDGFSKTFRVRDMLESCQSLNIFSDEILIEVRDPFFLTDKETEETEKLTKGLLEYCAHPFYECDLLFYTLEDRFNGKLRIYKEIASNAEVITCNGLDNKNFCPFARKMIREKGLSMRSDAESVLISLVRCDAMLLEKNLEVLSLYPETITRDVVYMLCTESEDTDNFELINAITAKDLNSAIRAERKIMKNETSVLPLLSSLGTQLRYLYYIAYLSEQGNRFHDIVRVTGHKDFRVQKAFEALEHLKMDEIMSLLKKLSDLNILIRSDSSMKETDRVEMFLISLVNA